MTITGADALTIQFHRAPIGTRGYSEADVDKFLDRIAKTLDGEDHLTAAQVHEVSFGRPALGKRGYDQQEVDAFLRQVESTLAAREGWTPHATNAYIAPALEHTHCRKPLWRRVRNSPAG
ncbi:DivIVA domain-containing protein [Amycolatopsis sp. YIM 10]|uniref:DivIVA domain-containing protein n=1 Tax=Amycolatopsis sp. YIM 10 TaxID=2653857 RepID=UPI0012901703|nr:DivIVA domain-containing protein [Amycolatopsis sp. YIM 10]QFU86159.1 Cell wall synthesis protein Wag31 [Amycolatopsis sp. YIM 10]